jgi:hypothetical protein
MKKKSIPIKLLLLVIGFMLTLDRVECPLLADTARDTCASGADISGDWIRIDGSERTTAGHSSSSANPNESAIVITANCVNISSEVNASTDE